MSIWGFGYRWGFWNQSLGNTSERLYVYLLEMIYFILNLETLFLKINSYIRILLDIPQSCRDRAYDVRAPPSFPHIGNILRDHVLTWLSKPRARHWDTAIGWTSDSIQIPPFFPLTPVFCCNMQPGHHTRFDCHVSAVSPGV